METKLERISQLSRENPEMVFTSIGHLIDMQFLLNCHRAMKADKAVGIDGVKKSDYEDKLVQEALRRYLDDKFDDYCTEDDYYQPVVEDFEAEECVKDWCKANGFQFISCDGEGTDDGYEPDIHRGGYW